MPCCIDEGSSPIAGAQSRNSLDLKPIKFGVAVGLSDITRTDLGSAKPKLLNFVCIVKMDLSHQQLTDLPVQLSECKSLQCLNVSHNNLDKVTCNLSEFSNLKRLDLSHNSLRLLPPKLSEVSMLSYLSVSHNQVVSLPNTMASTFRLNQLFLDNNMLTSLPLWVSKLSHCSTISLSNNPLDIHLQLSHDIGNVCRRLKNLDLSNTSTKTLPKALGKLLDLRHLTISNNKIGLNPSLSSLSNIVSLPSEFCSLVGLVKFEAVGVNLSDLPDSFHYLINLEILDLSNNQIIWLPSSFYLLPKLRFVNLSNNKVSLFPLNFEDLPSLKHLLASHNRISELPEMLGMDDKLVTLDMYDNQLTQVAESLIRGSLVRCDFAMNNINLENIDKDTLAIYRTKEDNLREWEDCLGEVFTARIQDGHQRSSSHKLTEVDASFQSHEELDDYYNIYTDDDSNEVEDDYLCKSVNKPTVNQDQELSTGVKHTDDIVEYWATEEDIYDMPVKFSFRHNLQNMHLEEFWGKEQFCPSDQHARPRSEKILEMLKIQTREVSRLETHGMLNAGTVMSSAMIHKIDEHQFDDADDDLANSLKLQTCSTPGPSEQSLWPGFFDSILSSVVRDPTLQSIQAPRKMLNSGRKLLMAVAEFKGSAMRRRKQVLLGNCLRSIALKLELLKEGKLRLLPAEASASKESLAVPTARSASGLDTLSRNDERKNEHFEMHERLS